MTQSDIPDFSSFSPNSTKAQNSHSTSNISRIPDFGI